MSKTMELYRLWEELIGRNIAMSEHLVTPTFHAFLSPFLKNNYFIFGNSKIRPIIHTLNIQSKGSGKGASQKLLRDALIQCGKSESKILNSFTSASIIGTLKKTKDGYEAICNLEGVDLCAIDEGSQITNGQNAFTKQLKLELNGFLDTGEIYKALANGVIQYRSDAVMSIGTFFDRSIQTSMLNDGFFDRFNISFREYSSQELQQLRREFDTIAISNNTFDNEILISKIREILKDINIYTIQQNIFSLDEQTTKYYGDKMEELLLNIEYKNRVSPLHLSIFEGCLARAKILGYKVMTQYSAIENTTDITTDAINYAITVIEKHLNSYIALLSNIHTPITHSLEEARETKQKVIAQMTEIVRNTPIFTKKIFENSIYKEGMFPRGYGLRRITEGKNSLLDEMVTQGILETRDSGHEIIFRVTQTTNHNSGDLQSW